MKHQEFILTAPANQLPCTDNAEDPSVKVVKASLKEIVASTEEWAFQKRRTVEADKSQRHPILYVVIRHHGKVFAYQRTKVSGEDRLKGDWSVGVGGHVDILDASLNEQSHVNIELTLRRAMLRELDEELNIHTDMVTPGQLEDDTVYYISNHDNDVGKTHFALIKVVDLMSDLPFVVDVEDTMSVDETPFKSLAELQANKEHYELWSQNVIDALAQEIL